MGNVLIIGNGFDLYLGLKTSYSDFAKSDFWPKNNPASKPTETGLQLGFFTVAGIIFSTFAFFV
ncbi:MAG: hypothetical protein IKM79_07315 [Bacteroidales bacterium]|nr:hypothetical protein [Bacteroidales bacterium]